LPSTTQRCSVLSPVPEHIFVAQLSGKPSWPRATISGAEQGIQAGTFEMVAGIECSIRAGDQRQKPNPTTPPGQLARDQHEPRQLLMHIVTGFCEAEPRLTVQIMRRDLDQAEVD
jgi:hypothetical protein